MSKNRDYSYVRAKSDKERTCLNCGKLFQSKGPGNRICTPCGKFNPNTARTKEVRLDTPGKGFVDSNY